MKEDILRKINADFGDDASAAIKVLENAIEKIAFLKTDRVLRCIVFLAKGKINDLHKYIEAAEFDTRDVMLWAEYEEIQGKNNFKRLRDFNNTFQESTNGVRE